MPPWPRHRLLGTFSCRKKKKKRGVTVAATALGHPQHPGAGGRAKCGHSPAVALGRKQRDAVSDGEGGQRGEVGCAACKWNSAPDVPVAALPASSSPGRLQTHTELVGCRDAPYGPTALEIWGRKGASPRPQGPHSLPRHHEWYLGVSHGHQRGWRSAGWGWEPPRPAAHPQVPTAAGAAPAAGCNPGLSAGRGLLYRAYQ